MNRILLSRLPHNFSEEEVTTSLTQQFGKVVSVQLFPLDGHFKFGYVDFDSEANARAALAAGKFLCHGVWVTLDSTSRFSRDGNSYSSSPPSSRRSSRFSEDMATFFQPAQGTRRSSDEHRLGAPGQPPLPRTPSDVGSPSQYPVVFNAYISDSSDIGTSPHEAPLNKDPFRVNSSSSSFGASSPQPMHGQHHHLLPPGHPASLSSSNSSLISLHSTDQNHGLGDFPPHLLNSPWNIPSSTHLLSSVSTMSDSPKDVELSSQTRSPLLHRSNSRSPLIDACLGVNQIASSPLPEHHGVEDRFGHPDHADLDVHGAYRSYFSSSNPIPLNSNQPFLPYYRSGPSGVLPGPPSIPSNMGRQDPTAQFSSLQGAPSVLPSHGSGFNRDYPPTAAPYYPPHQFPQIPVRASFNPYSSGFPSYANHESSPNYHVFSPHPSGSLLNPSYTTSLRPHSPSRPPPQFYQSSSLQRDQVSSIMGASREKKLKQASRQDEKVGSSKAKVKQCRYYLLPEGCPYGPQCRFAHGSQLPNSPNATSPLLSPTPAPTKPLAALIVPPSSMHLSAPTSPVSDNSSLPRSPSIHDDATQAPRGITSFTFQEVTASEAMNAENTPMTNPILSPSFSNGVFDRALSTSSHEEGYEHEGPPFDLVASEELYQLFLTEYGGEILNNDSDLHAPSPEELVRLCSTYVYGHADKRESQDVPSGGDESSSSLFLAAPQREDQEKDSVVLVYKLDESFKVQTPVWVSHSHEG